MTHRMVSAVAALVGLFVSLYLWLWHLGLMGSLACGTGGCEVVQTSRYAMFAGVPVALLGVIGYAAMLGVSLAGLHGRWAASPAPTRLLAALAALGVLFSGYLTYLEAEVIHAWCRWCVSSAIIVTVIFVTAVIGMRGQAQRAASRERGAEG
jgi:uncharacterized membrane protein